MFCGLRLASGQRLGLSAAESPLLPVLQALEQDDFSSQPKSLRGRLTPAAVLLRALL